MASVVQPEYEESDSPTQVTGLFKNSSSSDVQLYLGFSGLVLKYGYYKFSNFYTKLMKVKI